MTSALLVSRYRSWPSRAEVGSVSVCLIPRAYAHSATVLFIFVVVFFFCSPVVSCWHDKAPSVNSCEVPACLQNTTGACHWTWRELHVPRWQWLIKVDDAHSPSCEILSEETSVFPHNTPQKDIKNECQLIDVVCLFFSPFFFPMKHLIGWPWLSLSEEFMWNSYPTTLCITVLRKGLCL